MKYTKVEDGEVVVTKEYVTLIIKGLREDNIPEEFVQEVIDAAVSHNKRIISLAYEEIDLLKKLGVPT